MLVLEIVKLAVQRGEVSQGYDMCTQRKTKMVGILAGVDCLYLLVGVTKLGLEVTA